MPKKKEESSPVRFMSEAELDEMDGGDNMDLLGEQTSGQPQEPEEEQDPLSGIEIPGITTRAEQPAGEQIDPDLQKEIDRLGGVWNVAKESLYHRRKMTEATTRARDLERETERLRRTDEDYRRVMANPEVRDIVEGRRRTMTADGGTGNISGGVTLPEGFDPTDPAWAMWLIDQRTQQHLNQYDQSLRSRQERERAMQLEEQRRQDLVKADLTFEREHPELTVDELRGVKDFAEQEGFRHLRYAYNELKRQNQLTEAERRGATRIIEKIQGNQSRPRTNRSGGGGVGPSSGRLTLEQLVANPKLYEQLDQDTRDKIQHAIVFGEMPGG